MNSPERSSPVDDLPYLELWNLIKFFHLPEDGMVDDDYNEEEAEKLFDKCYPLRDVNHYAKETLNYICLGKNAPLRLKDKFL